MQAGPWVKVRVACDALVAVAAVLTIMLSLRVWFQATLTPPQPEGQVGTVSGALTGVSAHVSLWAAVGLAAVQIVLLLARYYPGGRLRVPGDSALLALGSGLICLLVTADFLTIPGLWYGILNATSGVPDPWEGTPDVIDGTTLVMTRTHAATVALEVALASLVFAVASLVVTKAGTRRSNARPVLLPRP
jgi:hypothetical protein